FFSSRRRHTRCYRDWSSDVCSSDLGATMCTGGLQECTTPPGKCIEGFQKCTTGAQMCTTGAEKCISINARTGGTSNRNQDHFDKIGRASCRERRVSEMRHIK